MVIPYNDKSGNSICHCGRRRPPHWTTCGGVVCSTTGKTLREAEAAAAASPDLRAEVVGAVKDAIEALDEVHDFAEEGDAIESAMLECHTILSTLLDRLANEGTQTAEPLSPPDINDSAVPRSTEHADDCYGKTGPLVAPLLRPDSGAAVLDVERLARAFTLVQPALYGESWPNDDPDDFQFLNPRQHAERIAAEYARLTEKGAGATPEEDAG